MCLVRVRLALVFLAIFTLRAFCSDGGAVASLQPPQTIVVGFVGGFVRHDNSHHGPVIFADRLQRTAPKGSYIQVFENRHRHAAYKTIVGLLDRNHDGVLSEAEKEQARIILYGQSWGGSAAVVLARELGRAGIPVLLTVQVDSIRKLWQHDRIIPDNVVAAANFYQPNGIFHGVSEITAADPSRTEILGNFRFDYRQSPVSCEGYSWLERNITRTHMESECDPRLWSQVEDLVRQRLDAHSIAVENKDLQNKPEHGELPPDVAQVPQQ